MQYKENRVLTTRQVATEGKREHQVPKVDHRWGIQCVSDTLIQLTGAFSHFLQATHSIPQPAATWTQKPMRQAGSIAILPLTGPF